MSNSGTGKREDNRIAYALNEIHFAIASLQCKIHTPFYRRVLRYMAGRRGKIPYWSDKRIAKEAIAYLRSVQTILTRREC